MTDFLNQMKSKKLYNQSKKKITSATCTYSKSANRYVEGVYPYFIEGGSGAFVYDLDGKQYIDYPCALGAIILGYAHPYVNNRLYERIKRGNIFSMPSVHEMELANLITSIIPSMESMRFLKSGSEAVSAAVKIARSYTKRKIVLSNGYHGWHDWSTPITEKKSGSPYSEHIISIEYDELEYVERMLSMNNVACVVIDPYIFQEPSEGYFKKLIKLAHKYGSLVIFDEVVTGIRWDKFSVQNSYGVKPDLTCLGKTLGNGVPISCVGGKRKIMDELNKDCFVSSTFGGDLIGIEAALATLKVSIDENLPDKIYESGSMLKDGYNETAANLGIETSCIGNPARQKLIFPSLAHKALFWQECLKMGVFLGSAQHTNLAHTPSIISQTLEIFIDSLKYLKLNWKDPNKVLEGNLPEDVMISAMRGK